MVLMMVTITINSIVHAPPLGLMVFQYFCRQSTIVNDGFWWLSTKGLTI